MLAVVSSLAACARTASVGDVAADCTCGEVWRAAWQTDRLAWDAERSRLESEIAALRKQLKVEGHVHDSTQSPTLQVGNRHVVSLRRSNSRRGRFCKWIRSARLASCSPSRLLQAP